MSSSTIAGYRLGAKLAVGGSGTVFAATRVADGERVAFKLMHAELEEQDAERHRFSREAEIVRQLVHPNVVQLLDYGHSERNVPFLVFSLLEGQTVNEHLETHGPMTAMEVGRLSLEVLSALERAHRLDIAHRDIKPANLFLIQQNGRLAVQVLDFGLAKILRGGKRQDITRTGALIGTPRYMAPEQVRAEPTGMAADIYSFGLVMAEMLIGRPLVDAEGELHIYMAHGSDRPLPIPRDVSESPFASVIVRAVAKPLEIRYQSASQMLADVHAVMALLEKGGGTARAEEPDLESTQVMRASELQALRQRQGSSTSKKLREAFNRLADKNANRSMEEAAVAADKLEIPEPRATIPMADAMSGDFDLGDDPPRAIPAPAESLPILLTRHSVEDELDEDDTQRIRLPKKR